MNDIQLGLLKRFLHKTMISKQNYFPWFFHYSLSADLAGNFLSFLFYDLKLHFTKDILTNPNRIQINNELKALSLACSGFNTEDENIRIISLTNIKNELDDQELVSWQKMISILSHEMMNTLSPIISSTETLSKIVNAIPIEKEKDTGTDPIKFDKLKKGLAIIYNRGTGLKNFIELTLI